MNNPDEEKKQLQPDDNDKEDKVVISKRIALVRHGQSLHNIDSDHWWTADNPLTKYGETQLQKLREKLNKQYQKEFYDKIDIVISSPLLRALQTTFILFNGMDIPMYVSSHHTEIYTADCDCGTNIDQLLKKYPHFKQSFNGWDQIQNNGKNWWPSEDEGDEVIEARHFALAEQLIKHEKKGIAVVGHGNFFKTFTSRFGKEHFSGNGEINQYVLKYQKKMYSLKHIHKISPPN